jgi:hypothetical protein
MVSCGCPEGTDLSTTAADHLWAGDRWTRARGSVKYLAARWTNWLSGFTTNESIYTVATTAK